jgi:tRNA A-37 threonylcarbamoyl transferase component Bud32
VSTAVAPTSRRRRRPSGEAPLLPITTGWQRPAIALGVVLALGAVLALLIRNGLWDQETVSASLRSSAPSWMRDLAARFDDIGDVRVVLAIRIAVAVVAIAFARWRHLVVFLVTVALSEWVVVRLLASEAAGTGSTEAFPSRPVATLTVTLVAMTFVLIPASRRRLAIWAAAGVCALFALATVLSGAAGILDAAYSLALGVAAPVAAFAAFVPDEAFPVAYRRPEGPSAHLDLGGERERAIREAVEGQIGFTVTAVEPFGLEGSGGSSPARLTVAEPPGQLFAKVYNSQHLRADRWYRIGRTMLYGRLEDEVPFASVRRLVEYEDYALRLLDDVGITVAHPYGVVELTPHREYLLVTEFLSGSTPMTDAEIDDVIIDDGLRLIRSLWDAGIAHRDIKPANLLVREGHLRLVDVSGVEVRPTPWREAVDLANMMLTLALRSDPDRVYERALASFTPGDVAEAFAADRGPAIPTQLRAKLKEDPRPIRERFLELAPDHEPVSIQRWSTRRVALIAACAIGTVVVAGMMVDAFLAGLR